MNQNPETWTYQQVIELEQYILSGNNEKIREATKYLKVYSKCKVSIQTYMQIISQEQDVGLRQLGAILLKKNILKHYQSLELQEQNNFKQLLIDRFFAENINVVRKSIGPVIGYIAQMDLNEGKWNELFGILAQKTDMKADGDTRKKGIQLLKLILGYSGDSMKNYYGSFYQFFVNSLQDQEQQIKIETVKCLLELFENIEYMSKDNIKQYKELINPMIEIMDMCIQIEDHETVFDILDGFNQLSESKYTMLDEHLTFIVQYVCGQKILLNNKIAVNIKEAAMDTIHVITHKHKSIFNKNLPLLKQMVETICYVVSLPLSEEDVEDGIDTLQDVGIWLLSTLGFSLNRKRLFATFLEILTIMLNTNDPEKMNAAFLILASISDSLQDQIRRSFVNPILTEFIQKGLTSQHVKVKGACIQAISYFIENLQDEVLKHHKELFPHIVQNFQDLNVKVASKALFAIDMFCDSLEEDLIPYLPELMPKILKVPFDQNATNLMKRASLSVFANCCISGEEHFKPYLPDCVKILEPILFQDYKPEYAGIICEGMITLGKFAGIFAKKDQEIYNKYIFPFIDRIYTMMVNIDDNEIREGGLSFFYNLAVSLEEGFEIFFDKIIEFTLVKAAQNEEKGGDGKGQDFSLDSDSEDEELLDDDGADRNVRVSLLDQKAAALKAMAEFSQACPLKFQPYFERAFTILDDCFGHFYDNVRNQTIQCYRDLTLAMIKSANGGKLPKFQKGLPCTENFSEQIQQFITSEVFSKIFHFMNNETSGNIVAVTLESLESLIRELGPAFILPNLDQLTNNILNLLENRGACQNQNSDDEENEEEETVVSVYESLTDLIPIIAKVLKDGFNLQYQRLFPSLMAYTQPNRELDDQIQMIGCFSQIFKYAPGLIQQSLKEFLPAVEKGLQMQDDEYNRNVAFCFGIMCEKNPPVMQQHLTSVLSCIRNIFETAQIQGTKDNATAAICRIIMAFPDTIPIANALQSILPQAPLKEDEEEQKTVLRLLLFLCDKKVDIITPHLELAIKLFIDGLANKKLYALKENVPQQIVLLLKNLLLQQNYKQIIEDSIMKLDEQSKNAVINLLK